MRIKKMTIASLANLYTERRKNDWPILNRFLYEWSEATRGLGDDDLLSRINLGVAVKAGVMGVGFEHYELYAGHRTLAIVCGKKFNFMAKDEIVPPRALREILTCLPKKIESYKRELAWILGLKFNKIKV